MENKTNNGNDAGQIGPRIMQPESGNIYLVKHKRKGVFKMFVEGQDEMWVHGLITDGATDAILHYNCREQFDDIKIRKSLCSFYEVE